MMSARVSARSTAKMDAERRLVERREREHQHRAKWNDRVDYYRSWEKANGKFEEWTSPRYYASNNRMIEELRASRGREEGLERRRLKLRRLLDEESRTHEIELMVRSGRRRMTAATSAPEVPTDVLRDVHLGLKLAEDDRKRHQAELALYHQWRNNSRTVWEHERARTAKDLKLSWLDRQVERRLEEERAEEECRRTLEERDRRLAEEGQREEERARRRAERDLQRGRELEAQVEALRLKQGEGEALRAEGEREAGRLARLHELERQREAERGRRRERELALDNLKLHKLKLKQRAADVRENLERERELVEGLLGSEAAERVEDERERAELKRAMAEFLRLARDQQDLERRRRKQFDFVFDSEARLVYERQAQVWREEEGAREALTQEVLATLKRQTDERVRQNRERQRAVLEERQSALRLAEQYGEDARRDREEERRRQDQRRRELEEQAGEKRAREERARARERTELDSELEAARKEEERLRREIAELQRRQGPVRRARSRIPL